ncbi:hypothetical protein CPT_Magnus_036 [Klebsiella phage Magnus]|uniref:Uncharacterized protein n=1 Tax=Klebsiella phage Magnus TaxID=2589660 RepID=A0A5B9N585_9CAUD|nr:hypothetical protein HYP92_gp205 [Klebsiella phage Magnus]QEG07915.1 hypothetical protein CPT_Magnus_036 [Klebsiella phage Magnus]
MKLIAETIWLRSSPLFRFGRGSEKGKRSKDAG